jgi:hypothetical protein
VIVLEALIEIACSVLGGLLEFWFWGGGVEWRRKDILSESLIQRRSRRRRLAIGCGVLLVIAVSGAVVLAMLR